MKQNKQNKFKEEALCHLNALYNMAYYLSSSKEEAEDLTQEVFYKAFKSFEQFTSGTNCKAWLFRILKNTFFTNQKQKKEVIEYTGFHDSLSDYHFSSPVHSASASHRVDPQDSYVIKKLDDDIQDALEQLPQEYRIPVILCDMEGMSYQEIAEIIGSPVGTVRSRISRGRHFLKKKLLKKYLELS